MDSTPLLSNGLKTQTAAQANKCSVQSSVHETIDGWKFVVLVVPVLRSESP